MDYNPEKTRNIFKERAAMVGSALHSVNTFEQALEYIIEVCINKKPKEILADDSRKNTAEKAELIIAAPEFSEQDFNQLAKLCQDKNIKCIKNGLNAYLGGIDLGIAVAELGIAASGTCILDCSNVEKRLSTMISEICVLILDGSKILPDLDQAASFMTSMLKSDKASTITFISGPSRTSDIERILTVGVHGPLELHIILIEG